jgi:hypothetical protein
MASACTDPVCAEGCDSPLPDVQFDLCAPQFNFGEISRFYLTNIGNPLIDETDLSEWQDRLALLAADPTRMLELVLIGDKPAAETPEVAASNGRTAYGPKNHTINLNIDDTNQVNYDFMRAMECRGSGQYLCWYATADGLLYGGASGIPMSIVLNDVIATKAELIKFVGTAKWTSKIHPCRTVNPMA